MQLGALALPAEAGHAASNWATPSTSIAEFVRAPGAGTCWSSRTTSAAPSHRRADRRRRRRDDRRRHRRGGARRRCGPSRSTAWCSTSAADMTGLELHRARSRRSSARPSCRSSSTPGKELTEEEETRARGGRRRDHRQGRPVAGAPARRDRAVPPPRRGQPAGAEAADARAAARGATRSLAGKKVLDRRRRRAQHLRAHQRARAPRDGGALRRERPRRHRGAASGRPTSTWC